MARTPVSFGANDFFKSFKKRYPSLNVGRSTHTEILACAGDVISEIMIEDSEFKLFSRMGSFLIRTIKPKGNLKRMIDFNETRKAGKNVYHFNDHSNGYLAKVIWDRKSCILPDKYMWVFKPVRKVKRQLAAVMKDGSKQYPIQL